MKTRLWKIIFAILLCGFLPVATAKADWITIAITAEVNGVTDNYGHLEGKIHKGDIITGYYSYKSTALDSNPSITVGDYEYDSPPAGISLECGGFIFRTDPNNVDFHISVGNNYSLGIDSYIVESYNNLPLSNGTLVDTIFWQLDDSTGTALSSDVLPLTAPDLSKWNSNLFAITGTPCGTGDFGIGATVISAVLIPEPATLLLLVFGIAIYRLKS